MNDLLSAITRSDLAGTADPLSVIFIIVMAFIAGVAIGFIYMWTHESLPIPGTSWGPWRFCRFWWP